MTKRSGFKVMTSLIGLVKPLMGYMILAIFMGLIGHLCATFITVFGVYAVLEYAGENSGFKLAKLMGISGDGVLVFIFVSVVIFALLRGFLRYAEQSCNHFIAFKLLALIRNKIFRALRKLCPAKLDGKDKGDLISVITADIELLEVFYAHTISPIAIAILFCIILCAFITSFHPLLGLIAILAYIVVGMVIPIIISKFSGDDGIRFRTKSGELSGFVLDSLRGLQETIQYADGNNRLDAISGRTEELSVDEERMKKSTGRNNAVTNTVILIFDLAMLFVATTLYQNGTIEFAGVLIPTITLMSSFGPCVALAALGSTLQNTFAAGNRVLNILEEEPVIHEVIDMDEVEFEGASVRDITFAYKEDNILSNISLDIAKGSVVGIVGKSGSGKSTLLKLLMRFWDVNTGQVKISDVNVDKINTANLRDMESFVTQDTHLFHDSIKNNLRIAKLDATDDEIIEACKKASVHDFIMSLPNGYDTEVGELGDTLSGGERQRLGLARAFLHNAPFILLDEPTSNLDSLNEAVILKALREEHKDKTVVLVSHRKSTMKIADIVYSVDCGRMS